MSYASPANQRAAERRYSHSEKGRATLAAKQRRLRARRTAEGRPIRHKPERNRAYATVQRALADGKLVRQPCWCGATKVYAHHSRGYEGPAALDVEWLCGPHHWEVHHR